MTRAAPRAGSPASQLTAANTAVNGNTTPARASAPASGSRARRAATHNTANSAAPNQASSRCAVASTSRNASTEAILTRGSRRWSALAPRLHRSNVTWCTASLPLPPDQHANAADQRQAHQSRARLRGPAGAQPRSLVVLERGRNQRARVSGDPGLTPQFLDALRARPIKPPPPPPPAAPQPNPPPPAR